MRFPGQLAAMGRQVFSFCVSPGVLCEAFKIIVVLSTPHCVSIAGFAVNPPVFEGVEAYPIKYRLKRKTRHSGCMSHCSALLSFRGSRQVR